MSPGGRALPLAIAAALALAPCAEGTGFLSGPSGQTRHATGAALDSDLRRAVGEALGCGDSSGHEALPAIQQQLQTMWSTMPKNSHGRIERRLLRYMAHRYFMQRSSLSIRGFEPSRPWNASSWSAEDILSQRVPAFVEGVLEGAYGDMGFTLEDVTTMVATLEQLIFDSEGKLLGEVYAKRGISTRRSLDKRRLGAVLELYMLRWLVGEDAELESNATLREEYVPHWQEVSAFAEGQIEEFGFARWRSLSRRPERPAAAGARAAAFAQEFSFQDAQAVAGRITKSFGPYWETVCQGMKASLARMDPAGTGRVRLSDFYGEAMQTEWRFGESESYLRQLGALDESSSWHGKQVIIPNYLQATSNCIVNSQHYSVCCANECEGLMGEIEGAVQAPVATPEEILSIVAKMTSPSGVDKPLELGNHQEVQLRRIAKMHSGRVPLHGRLFAQWLHYAFPRECPFPHKTGKAAQARPDEFGSDFVATVEEMGRHAHGVENATAAWEARQGPPPTDSHYMSQWSEEEELLVDYASQLRWPWLVRHGLAGAVGMAVCASAIWVGLFAGRESKGHVLGGSAGRSFAV